jgi:manganese transport protein
MVPLLHFTTSRRHLGPWKSGWAMSTLGWACAALIIAADIYALPSSLRIAWHVLAG